MSIEMISISFDWLFILKRAIQTDKRSHPFILCLKSNHWKLIKCFKFWFFFIFTLSCRLYFVFDPISLWSKCCLWSNGTMSLWNLISYHLTLYLSFEEKSTIWRGLSVFRFKLISFSISVCFVFNLKWFESFDTTHIGRFDRISKLRIVNSESYDDERFRWCNILLGSPSIIINITST